MNYWAKRTAKAQEKLTNKTIKETEEQLQKYYRSSMEKIIGQFEQTYNKVLLSMDEGKQPTPADLYKLDKYWQMQGQLRQELQKLGDKQAALMSKKFMEEYQQIYDSIALKDDLHFGQMDKQAAEQMINQIWCADGKSWSQRVWTNTDKLQQALNDDLIDCVIAGKKPSELKKKLQNDFNVSYSRADSIVRTEIAHVQTQAAQQRYKDYGITEVEVLVDADERTCEICSKLEGKRYPINGQMPVPAHPRCRCCIVPVVEDEKKVELMAEGSYNGFEPCYKDKIKFETNPYVKKAIKSETANFVLIKEPKDLAEYEKVLYGVNVAKTPPLEGYYDVKAHGNCQSIELYKSSASAETIAKILTERSDYKPGTPIRLLSCETGKRVNGRCFAQDLANMLGVEVIAPDFIIVVDGNGELRRGRFQRVEKKDFTVFTPEPKET